MSSKQGSAATSDAIRDLAQELLETFPRQLYVLTGITLGDPDTSGQIIVDLIVVDETAIFVGIDASQDRDPTAPPQMVAYVLAGLLERERLISEALPVYAFWVGETPPEPYADDASVLADVSSMTEYILLAKSIAVGHLSDDAQARLVEVLLGQDVGTPARPGSRVGPLGGALLGLAELPRQIDASLQRHIRSLPFRRARPILPADINKHLESAMLAPKNILEDTDYIKIVPNDYVVEVNADNYSKNYEPIVQELGERWQSRLVEVLTTTNSRWGRKAYKFGGPVRVRVRPAPDLHESDVRVSCRVNPQVDATSMAAERTFLERIPDGRRWWLREEIVSIGRGSACDIFLDIPSIQQARLVSTQHAYIIRQGGSYRLFDGVPGGPPSLNGTFVNGRKVGPDGHTLQDGDVVILAALDPDQPRADTPGVAAFSFYSSGA